jgi:hypothetical protein
MHFQLFAFLSFSLSFARSIESRSLEVDSHHVDHVKDLLRLKRREEAEDDVKEEEEDEKEDEQEAEVKEEPEEEQEEETVFEIPEAKDQSSEDKQEEEELLVNEDKEPNDEIQEDEQEEEEPSTEEENELLAKEASVETGTEDDTSKEEVDLQAVDENTTLVEEEEQQGDEQEMLETGSIAEPGVDGSFVEVDGLVTGMIEAGTPADPCENVCNAAEVLVNTLDLTAVSTELAEICLNAPVCTANEVGNHQGADAVNACDSLCLFGESAFDQSGLEAERPTTCDITAACSRSECDPTRCNDGLFDRLGLTPLDTISCVDSCSSGMNIKLSNIFSFSRGLCECLFSGNQIL